jgi:glycosyltransferase involved in cell wall biosynthesis
MNILMFSSDKTVVNGPGVGDAVTRVRKYGQYADFLDIIVYTNRKEKLEDYNISESVRGIPSNSRAKIFFFFDALKIFRKVDTEHRIDLVVCQDPFLFGLAGLWLKRKYGVKLLIHFHGDFWANPSWLKERPLNYVFWLISRLTVPRADGIRVMSPGQKEKLAAAGIDEKKIVVISTPVNFDYLLKFKNEELSGKIKEQLGGRTMVLMAGRKDKVKGFDVLFAAMKKVQRDIGNVSLWLAGNYTQDEIGAMIAPKSMDIVALGPVAPADLPAYYYACELAVLSSYSESFGKVLVEANACGRPVVATATTGAKEIVEDGVNGYLVPIGDADALAGKILHLLHHADRAREMGEAGRKMVIEKYGDNTRKIAELWEKIVNKSEIRNKL